MATVNGKEIWKLRVVELRKELERRGLDKSGLKSDLVERLENSMRSEQPTDTFEKPEPLTTSQDSCKKCNDFSIEMVEVKLELAMLWALVNAKPTITASFKNATTQTADLSKYKRSLR